jgi:hypothetical protein
MNSSPDDLWRAVLPVVEALEGLDVPYYIGGSVASSYVGVSRTTMDADLVAALELGVVHQFHERLGLAYYADRERIEQAVRQRRSFNLVHLDSVYKVDVFVPGNTPFSAMNFARRVALEIPELSRSLHFASPEDIVLHKLRWYSSGGGVSDRHWSDEFRVRNCTLSSLRPVLNSAVLEGGLGWRLSSWSACSVAAAPRSTVTVFRPASTCTSRT